jgi:hypothetical protein
MRRLAKGWTLRTGMRRLQEKRNAKNVVKLLEGE